MMVFALRGQAIQLALDGHRHFDRVGRQQIEKQADGCRIDIGRGQALAGGAPCVGLIHTDVARPRGVALATAIADIHRAAAPPADHAALQQGGSFTWRTKGRGAAEVEVG